jgi:hypothetical protein
MNSLSYATITEAFGGINELEEKYANVQQKVSEFETKYKLADNNHKEINNDITQIQSHPARTIKKEDFEENPKLKQMKEDSQSILMQNKFTISLGAIAVASMIILHSQL